MTVVIMIILMVSMLASAALTVGFHHRTLAKKAVGSRTQSYYFAQAGLVDAQEALRKDPGGLFVDPSYDPAPYTIDVDADGVADATVDIGPRVAATGYRAIRSTGRS